MSLTLLDTIWTMRGPLFLVLYGLFGVAGIIAIAIYPRIVKPKLIGEPVRLNPYTILYNTKTYFELLGFVMQNLYCKGFVKLAMNKSRTKLGLKRKPKRQSPNAAGLNEIELAILNLIPEKQIELTQSYASFTSSTLIERVTSLLEQDQPELARYGLAYDHEYIRKYRLFAGTIMGVTIAIALIKIIVAVATGHHNIMFLIFMVIILGFIQFRLHQKKFKLTTAGENYLSNLKLEYALLPSMEIIRTEKDQLVYAVLGKTALDGNLKEVHMALDKIHIMVLVAQKAKNNRDGSSFYGCGCSSCSSCSSGGGCGGGCGGCGGCGG